jgi:hypothetical protein
LIPKYSGIALMFLATLLESEYVSSSSEALSRVSDGNKGVTGELKKFNNQGLGRAIQPPRP